jgi:hypothetical protein
MVPKIMLEGGHAWVHERPIAAGADHLISSSDRDFLRMAIG